MRIVVFLSVMFIAVGMVMAQNTQDNDSIHKPILDLDGDYFSSSKGFRGTDWRGKDGSDLDEATRPGCKDSRGLFDNNCNGISGWNDNGESYEEIYCEKSKSRGVVVFGDSAAAAFHIPEEWIKMVGLTPEYAKLLDFAWIEKMAQKAKSGLISRDDKWYDILLNEFDWPHKSWATGFSNDINGESIYLKLRSRNQCNHRDYQNLAVNGARSKHFLEQVGNLARTPADKPVLAFMGYIGNDICKKSLDKMSTPEEFRAGITAGLDALENKLPAGSQVVMIGLVDGRILWDTMHNRKHPLGVTYAELYNLLHSFGGNPCRTWLTPDEDMRNKASARAAELSAVLKDIATNKKYRNFQLSYLDLPMKEVLDNWKKQGKDVAELIEVVDGFHPSLTCHRELSKVFWKKLTAKKDAILGPENKSNEDIKKAFGEQGGH